MEDIPIKVLLKIQHGGEANKNNHWSIFVPVLLGQFSFPHVAEMNDTKLKRESTK